MCLRCKLEITYFWSKSGSGSPTHLKDITALQLPTQAGQALAHRRFQRTNFIRSHLAVLQANPVFLRYRSDACRGANRKNNKTSFNIFAIEIKVFDLFNLQPFTLYKSNNFTDSRRTFFLLIEKLFN